MYPHQELGSRPMYRNTFWTSPYWMMPAGAGCQRTGRVRDITGLDQIEWCCPGPAAEIWNPYSYLGALAGPAGMGVDPSAAGSVGGVRVRDIAMVGLGALALAGGAYLVYRWVTAEG